MGNQTQLQQLLTAYIGSIAAKGTVTADDEKELTTHLYETVESLTKNGLTTIEAFEVAKLRLGKEEVLVTEFEKVNGVNLLNKEWVFIFIGVGLTIIAYRFINFLEFWLGYKNVQGIIGREFGGWCMVAGYLLLIALTILCFRKGEKFTKWVKEVVFDKNRLAISILATLIGLLCIDGIVKVIPHDFNSYDKVQTAIYQMMMVNRTTEFIIKGTIPSLVIFSIILSTQSVNQKLGWHTLFKSTNYLYLLLLSFAVEALASMFSRGLCTNLIISPFIFGITYFAGVFAYLKYNSPLSIPRLLAFLSFTIYFEMLWGYLNNELLANIGTLKSPYTWAVIAAIILAFAIKKWQTVKAQKPI